MDDDEIAAHARRIDEASQAIAHDAAVAQEQAFQATGVLTDIAMVGSTDVNRAPGAACLWPLVTTAAPQWMTYLRWKRAQN